MMNGIGQIVERDAGQGVVARARARAALIPDLLVEARRVANTVFAGWHGRRRRGIGENFWQFRPYVEGENIAAIDWRRSARDDHVYVRDREWQATHTVWLWVDESPSMLFKSGPAIVSKQSRALVLAFAMAELLARSGERVGWIGLGRPQIHRHAAERLAEQLLHAPPQESLGGTDEIRDFADIILISDFLSGDAGVETMLAPLLKKRVRAHLVQVIDPAEEEFPYSGRVEFHDPETGRHLNFGAAQTLRADYRSLFQAHGAAIGQLASRNGWSHVRHHTDRLASEALQSLHLNLSDSPDLFANAGGRS